MSKEIITVREQRKAIEALDTVHGFDLPYIYSLLVRTEMSGYLNVVRTSGEIFSVTFTNGRISGVDTDDEHTLLGKLLIESGYVMPEDLAMILSPPQGQRKIGERLVGANLLSPHGLEKVLSAQMSLRLSRTIVDENMKLNFALANFSAATLTIDDETFDRFLHDSVASKITLAWLKAHFTRSLNDEVIPGPLFTADHALFSSPLVRSVPDLREGIEGKMTVAQILQSETGNEEARTKALFFLLIEGVIAFRKTDVQSGQGLAMLLQKIWQQFSGKNQHEARDILVRMTGGIEGTTQEVRRDFMRLIGQREDAKNAGQLELYNKIVTKLEAVLAEGPAPAENPMELSHNMIRLDGFQKFEKGQQELQAGNYRVALDLLKQAEAQDSKIGKLGLYLCWAKVGLNDKGLTKEIDLQLMMIPPEDKYDAVYSYVLGLHARNKGELKQARKYFEKSLALDTHFIFARRELAKLQNDAGAKNDVFNGDLTTVVANLFQRKKSG